MSELDRLLADACEADPDELSPSELARWVDEARAPRGLDALLAQAREAEPPALDALETRRVAERAAIAGRAQHLKRARWWWAATAVAAAAAAAMVTMMLRPERPVVVAHQAAPALEETHEPTEIELPTGDRLRASAGTRFGVQVESDVRRRVRLEAGAMLFDVRPLEGGRFVVSTPRAEVTVLGTVFSVATSEGSTTVRVYEGRVRVEDSRRTREIAAGGELHLGPGAARPDRLAAAGREAAARRTSTSERTSEVPANDALSPRAPAARPAPAPVRPRPAPARPRAAIAVPRPTPAPPPPATATELRRWIAEGDAQRALVEARARISAGQTRPWRMLEGDALRALGRSREAADVYRYASDELPSPGREQAAFLEARLRSGPLRDPAGALSAIRRGGVLAPGSLLRERGMATEVELLRRMQRWPEHDAAVDRYLRTFPNGPSASAFRAASP